MAVFSRIFGRAQPFEGALTNSDRTCGGKISGESLDGLFDGRLLIAQGVSGYRFSIDALLLAHFVTVGRAKTIVDLGSGNGVIAMILAHFHPHPHIVGVELQSSMVDRARRSIRRNGFENRVQMLQADVRDVGRQMGAGGFDVAVCNPPYRRAVSGRVSAGDERRVARHELNGGIEHFLAAAAVLLRSKGRLALVQLAGRTMDVLVTMRRFGVEPKRIRMVHSYSDAEASLLLVEGVKGGKAGLTVHSPLILYRSAKQYTAEAAALIAGMRQ